MIFAEIDTATLKTQLAEAREAYRQLVMGRAVAEVQDQNGEQVRYSRANINELSRFIRMLEMALAERGEADYGSGGPANVWMGVR